jgi:hypothetical protein
MSVSGYQSAIASSVGSTYLATIVGLPRTRFATCKFGCFIAQEHEARWVKVLNDLIEVDQYRVSLTWRYHHHAPEILQLQRVQERQLALVTVCAAQSTSVHMRFTASTTTPTTTTTYHSCIFDNTNWRYWTSTVGVLNMR